jgi:hypothetical protein
MMDAPPFGTFGSVAGWAREHGAAMSTAVASAPAQESDPIDELDRKRAQRRGA